ncbi:MAG: hypothetical protein JRE20_10955 [Deltaproteobacteria bacterium]|nr:hypothetical protein [Deltaproteobacteria bacterium]
MNAIAIKNSVPNSNQAKPRCFPQIHCGAERLDLLRNKASRISFAEIDAQTLGASPVIRVLPFRLIDLLLSHDTLLIQFLPT